MTNLSMSSRDARRKLQCLAGMLVVSVVCGAFTGNVDGDRTTNSIVAVLSGVTLVVLALCWCEADARQHGVEPSKAFAILFVICRGPIVMTPYHLVATRGLSLAGLWATLKALLFPVFAGVVWELGELLGVSLG
jgi:hypothetical protein